MRKSYVKVLKFAKSKTKIALNIISNIRFLKNRCLKSYLISWRNEHDKKKIKKIKIPKVA